MSWLRCSACKRDIGFGAAHWVCSVSTCNRHNTNYKFCSVACWDSHVATLRHRDAWAVEARAPSKDQWAREQMGVPSETAGPGPRPMPGTSRPGTVGGPAPAPGPAAAPAGVVPRPAAVNEAPRRLVPPPAPAPSAASAAGTGSQLTLAETDRDMLIVVSKLKKYIKDRSGMNCSDAVADVLSDHVRAICDESIRAAGRDERKTVLDRDVPKPRR